jgi:hypothetical protein
MVNCDEFPEERVPVDHPMQLHRLFGPNASTTVDAAQTAALLHDAAAYQQQVDAGAVQPPTTSCWQTSSYRPGKQRPKIGEQVAVSSCELAQVFSKSCLGFCSCGDDDFEEQLIQ